MYLIKEKYARAKARSKGYVFYRSIGIKDVL